MRDRLPANQSKTHRFHSPRKKHERTGKGAGSLLLSLCRQRWALCEGSSCGLTVTLRGHLGLPA